MFQVFFRIVLGALLPIGIFCAVNMPCVLWTERWVIDILNASSQADQPRNLAAMVAQTPEVNGENAATLLASQADRLDAVDQVLQPLLTRKNFQNSQFSASELAALRLVLSLHKDLLPTLRRTASADDYRPTVFNPNSENSQIDWERCARRLRSLREAQQTLGASVRLSLFEKDREQAVQDCVLMFRLARLAEGEPMKIGHSAALDCRRLAIQTANVALRYGAISRAVRDELEAELAMHHPEKSYQRALDWERCALVDHEVRWRSDSLLNAWPLQAVANVLTCRQLRLLDLDRTSAGLTWNETPTALRDDALMEAIEKNGGTQLPTPSLRQETFINMAQLRCLRLLNALQAHGVRPTAGDLSYEKYGLPADMTTDPFNGQPLRVKGETFGLVIYSVGPNLADDDGEKDTDVTLEPLLRKKLVKTSQQLQTPAGR